MRSLFWTPQWTQLITRNVFLNFLSNPSAKQTYWPVFNRPILGRTQTLALVPGKPISANPGLNISNQQINFIPRLHSVPESTIKTNLGVNRVLNLTYLARTVTSIIGGKVCQKKQNGGFSVPINWPTNTRMKVPTVRNWPQPTNRQRPLQKI